MQVGKLDEALTKIRENWWTDPVIDCGSLTEYSQAFFPFINSLIGHNYILSYGGIVTRPNHRALMRHWPFGQRECKGRTLTDFAFDPNLPAMQLNKFLCQS
jgi:hypothetical protein